MKRMLALLTFLSIIFLTACTTPADPVQNTTLLGVKDQAELVRLLRPSNHSNHPFNFGFRTLAEDAAMTTAESDASQGSSTSQTNVQVPGIDEGDRVKVDQNRLYRIDHQQLYVIDLLAQGQMTTRLRLDAPSDGYFTELYLTDDYLIVLSVRHESLERHRPSDGDEPVFDIGFGWWHHDTYTVVDLYEKTSLEHQDRFEIKGHAMTTRLKDDQLILVHTYTPNVDQNDDVRPVFKHNDTLTRPSYETIHYLPSVDTEAFLILSTITLNDSPEADHTTFLGNYHWGPIYVNHRGITFASHQYHVVSERFNNRVHYHAVTTLVHFAFTDASAPEYAGNAQINGHILNQFSMDEYEGYLRVFTTESRWDWETTRAETINRLYVLKHEENTLTQVALIDEGIGKPHETIRSARFMGPMATVVTFELIDPFYTIDLSDPYAPEILGELEITGFSTYQHPWLDNYIIGLGYETDARGMTIGLKLTLYNIEDTHNPVVVGEPTILLNQNQGWQFAEALHNHKAILVSEDHQIFGFSLNRLQWLENYQQQISVSEYLLFTINPEADMPITISARINHQALAEEAIKDINAGSEVAMRYHMHASVERAVYVGDILYVISHLGVTSHPLEAPHEQIDTLRYPSE